VIEGISDDAKRRLEAGLRAGGVCSDGPVRDGWAVHPFKGSVAHLWAVQKVCASYAVVETACGLVTIVTDQVSLLGIGSYAPCRRCDAAALKGLK
jgi:hypothetical protein